jgi:hypothetical protein
VARPSSSRRQHTSRFAPLLLQFSKKIRPFFIDSMRQGSIVGSVWPLHGPGRQRSHASAGQPDRPEGEDQLALTTSQKLGPYRRRTFLRTRQTNQMCSTNSLRLRGRQHRLPGIHRVSNGPGYSYPAAERHANVLCEANRYRFSELRQM